MPGRRARWAKKGDGFTVVSPIDAEIFLVDGNDRVAGEQFTQTDQAQVSKIGLAVLIALGQLRQTLLVLGDFESDTQHPVLDEG